ncbi:MAG: tRNA 5-methoxyuridine(34)/uridine 5-oxyacetic acid(34) synthase CmoB [Halochromatium sp.]
MPELRRLDRALMLIEQALSHRFAGFFEALRATPLAAWAPALERRTAQRLRPDRHGDLGTWVAALERLPALPAERVTLDRPCVGVAREQPLPAALRTQLQQALESLQPWRKGPFCLHGVKLNAEWRSDWKWARLAGAIAPLGGRRVLDVGCGNGYYGFRALGAGADLVLGIDPTPRFVLQFLALNRLIGAERLAVLPLADDDLPDLCQVAAGGFDTLFSMGVLYHRRDPTQHLARLRDCLRPGGELVLETLVIDRPESFEQAPCKGASANRERASGDRPGTPQTLIPAGRYARMRNVHAIPSVATLMDWIAAAGYREIRLVDLSRTTTQEQRATPWMRFQSLADFLDPRDPNLTVEGHPAPVRALLLAERAR